MIAKQCCSSHQGVDALTSRFDMINMVIYVDSPLQTLQNITIVTNSG